MAAISHLQLQGKFKPTWYYLKTSQLVTEEKTTRFIMVATVAQGFQSPELTLFHTPKRTELLKPIWACETPALARLECCQEPHFSGLHFSCRFLLLFLCFTLCLCKYLGFLHTSVNMDGVNFHIPHRKDFSSCIPLMAV